MQRRPIDNANTGLTRMEVLVLLAILFVLVSLVLPALNHSGNAHGDRMECANNLRNLAQAIQVRDTLKANAFLPATAYGTGPLANLLTPSSARDELGLPIYEQATHTWCVELLPYLERGGLYDSWAFEVSDDEGNTVPVPWNSTDDRKHPGGNSALAETRLTVFRCPSDTSQVADLSYVANGGFAYPHPSLRIDGTAWDAEDLTHYHLAANKRKLGLMFPTAHGSTVGLYTTSTIPDGTDTTILFSESVNSYSWANPNPANVTFYGSFFPQPDGISVDGGPAGKTPYDFTRVYGDGVNFEINGNTSGLDEGALGAPQSMHPGGVNIAMASGVVLFLSDTVDRLVYARLLTPAGAETVDPATGQPDLGSPADGTAAWTQQPLEDGSY